MMTTRSREDWTERAKCRGCVGSEYDSPANLWRARKISADEFRQLLADTGRVCDGCPVMRECAADVNRKDVEVIRAGVPLPSMHHIARGWRMGLGDVFNLIARGVSPAIALACLDMRGHYE